MCCIVKCCNCHILLAVDMAGVACQGLAHVNCSRLRFRCRRNHCLIRKTERNRTVYSGKYLPRALENIC